MNLAPYLHFSGDCEAALARYIEVFGGKVEQVMRFSDAPPNAAAMTSHEPDGIMHASFASPTIKFMCSDSSALERTEPAPRITLSLETRDGAEGRRVFEALGEGGTIEVPLAPAFWGGDFGMLTDAFGITWTVSC